jgi:hypothetical protein
MGFTPLIKQFPGGLSKFWNPHDQGARRPDPVVCDSVLDFSKVNDTTNAELTIYLKVWFVQVPSTVGKVKDTNGNEFAVRDWTPEMDFPGWCRRVTDAVNKTWDNKLILSLPEKYDGMDWAGSGGVWRPQIRCRFVFLVGDPSYYHCRVQVVVSEPHPEGLDFRSHSRLWEHVIAYEMESSSMFSPAGMITQVTAAHEVGHLMGLPHIGKLTAVKNCTMWTDGNELACYGKDDPNPSLTHNIMGLGMNVTEFNGRPWKQELCKHVNRDETFGGLSPDELWCSTDLAKGPTKR